MTQLEGIVEQLKKEHERLSNQIRGISAALTAFGNAYGNGGGTRRKLSAAAKARIAEGQRRRWARQKGTGAAAVAKGSTKKRVMSASARKKIAAAQKLRWQKIKAAKKSA